MRHWYWCVLMLILLLVLTVVVFSINALAGCVAAGFSAVIYLLLLGLDLYFRPKVLQELIDFANH